MNKSLLCLLEWSKTPGNKRDSQWWYSWHKLKDDALKEAYENGEIILKDGKYSEK